MKINWRVRFKNPVFIIQLLGAVALPVLGYYALHYEDITSWGILGGVVWDAVRNPFVLGLMAWSFWSAINDPTVAGAGDSKQAQRYEYPKDPKGGF